MKRQEITAALKGLAVLIVILGHYAQYFATDYYERWFRGYAYGVVALFFVLAGYGAYFSLQKRLDQTSAGKAVSGYFLNRAVPCTGWRCC